MRKSIESIKQFIQIKFYSVFGQQVTTAKMF